MENEIKKKSTAKFISRISVFVLVFTIILALIFDFVIFNDVLKQFVAALIVPSIFFVFLCIAFVCSFVVIIGFYLVKEYGFWPIDITRSLFNEIIGEITISDSQINQFTTCRYILIFLCIVAFSLALFASIKARSELKEEAIKKHQAKAMGKSVMVLSILGILISIAAIMLITSH